MYGSVRRVVSCVRELFSPGVAYAGWWCLFGRGSSITQSRRASVRAHDLAPPRGHPSHKWPRHGHTHMDILARSLAVSFLCRSQQRPLDRRSGHPDHRPSATTSLTQISRLRHRGFQLYFKRCLKVCGFPSYRGLNRSILIDFPTPRLPTPQRLGLVSSRRYLYDSKKRRRGLILVGESPPPKLFILPSHYHHHFHSLYQTNVTHPGISIGCRPITSPSFLD